MKTKEQIKLAMELFAVRMGKFQYSNPSHEFGGGKVLPDPVFIKHLNAFFLEILPEEEDIKDMAARYAAKTSSEPDDKYDGFILGANAIIKLITE